MSKLSRDSLVDWVHEALRELGGSGSILLVAKKLWELHGKELTPADDLFFTWQYDMRWAAQKLRDKGLLENSHTAELDDLPKGMWRLTSVSADVSASE